MAESLQAAVRHCAEEPVRSLLQAPNVQSELNKLGSSGSNALGLAVWRNHVGLVEALLEAGADPDAQDSESGWSALHRALHFGQLRIAAALLQANASLSLADWHGRSPLDLLSVELREFIEPGGNGDVFSWGNGSNFTLGTGSTDLQLHPVRLGGLHDLQVATISAAKFHSAAVSVDGRLLTWGWGRGGRLGHPDAHVHSGEGAVIAPLVVSGIGKRCVAAVAAAKHHTVLCTTAGEVFTMGSNRHGQLGYAVDGQPTPRRVSSLRQRVVAVAAANKHTVAVTVQGDVYTWGSNVLGQLGYGTSDSVSNAAPRLVEAMRCKAVVAAAAAKRHTLVLTASGEVYTWGHRGVSPRRVQLAGTRDALTAGGAAISFHRGHSDVARPAAAAISAGAAHSAALTRSGVVLTWRSADPALQVQEVGGMLAGKHVVSIAAGKYRTAAVSDAGDVYMWEGRSDYFPAEGRQPGSGSKKLGCSSATRARPIPRGASGGMRMSLGGEATLGGSYGAADDGGSCGSHTRRPGTFIERFARERKAAAASCGVFGTSPAAAATPGSFGAGSGGGVELSLGSGSGPSRASDVFEKIQPERVEGLKRAAVVAVGEKHSLAVQRWSAAQLEGMVAVPWLQAVAPLAPPGGAAAAAAAADGDRWYQHAADELVEGGQPLTPRGLEAESSSLANSPSPRRPSPVRPGPQRAHAVEALGVPSLQRICEEEVARRLVDTRTCLQVLEYADVAGAELLRAYCMAVAVCNLDAVLLEAGGAFTELAPHLLAELERLFKLRLAGCSAGAGGSVGAPAAAAGGLNAPEPAGAPGEGNAGGTSGKRRQEPLQPGSRLQPGRRPTAAAPWLGDKAEAEGFLPGPGPGFGLHQLAAGGGSSFRNRSEAVAEAAAQRLLRMLQKKLQQIEQLEAKAAGGAALDPQQQAKVQQRHVVQSAAAALEGGMALDDVQAILRAVAGDRETGAALGQTPASTCKAAAAATAARLKSCGKNISQKELAAEARGSNSTSAAAAAAPEPVGAEASGSSLLGSSPPSSSLVPVFGPAGSAAAVAEQPHTPSGAAEQPSTPAEQVRSLVGFASSSATDGVAAAAQRSPGQQEVAAGLRLSSTNKHKSASKRKGGLSMFLRGELEQAAMPAGPSMAEESSGRGGTPAVVPAWSARAAAPAGATSLKQILDQEAAGLHTHGPQVASAMAPMVQHGTPNSRVRARSVEGSLGPAAAGSAAGPQRMTLQSFMQSRPVAVQHREGPSPPPAAWGGAMGCSPPARHASFRAIQEEQEASVSARPAMGTSPPAGQRLGIGMPPWRPPQLPAGSAAPGTSASLLGTSPSASTSLLGTSSLSRATSFLAAPVPQHSKWYVPEERRADRKSLKIIQTEEEALAALVKEKEALAALAALAKQYGEDSLVSVAKSKASSKPKPAKAHKPSAPAASHNSAEAPSSATPDLPRPKPSGGRPCGKKRGSNRPGSGDKPCVDGKASGGELSSRRRGGSPDAPAGTGAPTGNGGSTRKRRQPPEKPQQKQQGQPRLPQPGYGRAPDMKPPSQQQPAAAAV